ncbi:AraC family transcriptional regulator [Opitutaceae bacterium TAV4]|nr:AraC family transcriptional regulator [Opitutaceae bacterium TAV4]
MCLPPPPPPPPPSFISRQIGRHRYFFADLVTNISSNPVPRGKGGGAAGLVVACGGWEQCAPDYRIERKTFHFHAVELVCQGRGWLEIAGKTTPLLAGSIFSYGPGLPHIIRSDPLEPLEKYFVDFSGREAGALVADLQRAAGGTGVMQVSRVDLMAEWFEQLLEAGSKSGRQSARICTLLTELIVRHAVENAFVAASAVSTSQATYERCRTALRRDFLSLCSAEELARSCHLDPAYMARLFQKYGDESAYQMLVRLKMNHAAGRLTTGTQPLKEIGAEVGFPDPYHFSRVFKRTFGLAPKAFRERYHRGVYGGGGGGGEVEG